MTYNESKKELEQIKSFNEKMLSDLKTIKKSKSKRKKLIEKSKDKSFEHMHDLLNELYHNFDDYNQKEIASILLEVKSEYQTIVNIENQFNSNNGLEKAKNKKKLKKQKEEFDNEYYSQGKRFYKR